MSGMAIGSMIEADNRLRAHELEVRKYKRVMRDAEVWRRYVSSKSSCMSDSGRADTPLGTRLPWKC